MRRPSRTYTVNAQYCSPFAYKMGVNLHSCSTTWADRCERITAKYRSWKLARGTDRSCALKFKHGTN